MGCIILIVLLLLAINVPVIGTAIMYILAFWLIAEGVAMFIAGISNTIKRKF